MFHLQANMDVALIAYMKSDPSFTVDYSPRVKEFPWPAYTSDKFANIIGSVFPLLLVLTYLYTVVNIIRTLIHEREIRIREAMKMMVGTWPVKFMISC